ncbi:hypothetical protein C1645_876090 [Glomus cerebriforme]|uniref:MARVEL domain-containing protein n=1 Tax=Glomus cerebriforme TaxID=658196 RepID=A0A397T5Q5_9GLOM|nr:hypothetical protein C1645_876090 [Glomus cerebriforme]
MHSRKAFISVLILLISIQFPIIIACLVFGWLKIQALAKYDYNFKFKNIYFEFTSLFLGFLNIVFLGRVYYIIAKKRPFESFYIVGVGCFSLCWVLLVGLYTVAAFRELNKMPITCPSNYPYEFPELHHICQANTADLISLWIMGICSLITMSCACCIMKRIIKEEKDDDNDDDEEKN